ncbi:MAG: trypsin-like peptidase domain-containing protein [Phycisphaerae bacterium]|jgi:serine protease Do
MSRVALSFVSWLAVGAAGLSAPERSPPVAEDALRDVVRAATATVAPSIVRIDTIGGVQPVERANDSQPAEAAFRTADGPTTGVVWSSDGYVVTSSFNFSRDPSIITVTLHDGSKHVARLVARDRVSRLALLKIEAEGLPVPHWLPVEAAPPGSWAIAAGFGHGTAEPSLSVGVISAVRRMNGVAVQTDARISPANYGGPLFNIDGGVIGICVPMGPGEDEIADAQWYDSGIGFAVHYEHLSDRVARLMTGRDPRRGVLGVTFDSRDAVAGIPESQPDAPAGIRIMAPPVGPAAAAGLQEGDVVTRIDGVPTPRLVDVRRQLVRRAAGDRVAIEFWRAGQTRTAEIALAAPEELRPAASQPGG